MTHASHGSHAPLMTSPSVSLKAPLPNQAFSSSGWPYHLVVTGCLCHKGSRTLHKASQAKKPYQQSLNMLNIFQITKLKSFEYKVKLRKSKFQNLKFEIEKKSKFPNFFFQFFFLFFSILFKNFFFQFFLKFSFTIVIWNKKNFQKFFFFFNYYFFQKNCFKMLFFSKNFHFFPAMILF